MKRLFLALAMIVGISAVGVCQNVNINVENGSHYGDGYKFINGICSCDDIGGVEHSTFWTQSETNNNIEYFWAHFVNYNNFRVTVLYEVVINREDVKVGSIVIEPNGSKDVYLDYAGNGKGIGTCDFTGLIVRKLAQ